MKLCDAYKCKRLALGLTQAEIANIIGVSSGTISRFENGEVLSEVVFNSIRYGIDNYFKSLDRDEYMERRLLESAYELMYQSDEEKLLTLNHMAIHIGKLNMDLLRKVYKGETES